MADLPYPIVTAAGPTPSAMRRALRRARDGVALDETEAGVLLQARGADLDALCHSAARVRDQGLVSAGRAGDEEGGRARDRRARAA